MSSSELPEMTATQISDQLLFTAIDPGIEAVDKTEKIDELSQLAGKLLTKEVYDENITHAALHLALVESSIPTLLCLADGRPVSKNTLRQVGHNLIDHYELLVDTELIDFARPVPGESKNASKIRGHMSVLSIYSTLLWGILERCHPPGSVILPTASKQDGAGKVNGYNTSYDLFMSSPGGDYHRIESKTGVSPYALDKEATYEPGIAVIKPMALTNRGRAWASVYLMEARTYNNVLELRQANKRADHFLKKAKLDEEKYRQQQQTLPAVA